MVSGDLFNQDITSLSFLICTSQQLIGSLGSGQRNSTNRAY